jgi:hypothetical protein
LLPEQSDQHRVVVRGPDRLWSEELRRILVGVSEHRRGIGVHVPDRGASDVGQQARTRERVVEATGRGVEDVAVGVGPDEPREEVDEARVG